MPRLTAIVLAGLAFLPLQSAAAQKGLPNLKQAQEISRLTGRPILAMAGRST